jgi:hypothetical protein
MSNMSYCRFENTLNDLVDCFNNIHEEAENERDERARKLMIRFLFENINLVEDLKEELDQPIMYLNEEEWEREMGR